MPGIIAYQRRDDELPPPPPPELRDPPLDEPDEQLLLLEDPEDPDEQLRDSEPLLYDEDLPELNDPELQPEPLSTDLLEGIEYWLDDDEDLLEPDETEELLREGALRYDSDPEYDLELLYSVFTLLLLQVGLVLILGLLQLGV